MNRNKLDSILGLNRGKKTLSMKIVFTIAFILIGLYALFILFFFLFGLILSLKDDSVMIGTKSLWDSLRAEGKLFSIDANSSRFANYVDAFTEFKVLSSEGNITYVQMLWNSIWRTTLATVINWFCTVMVCYILVFYRNRYTKGIYNFGLIISIIPLYGAGAAEYMLFNNQYIPLVNSPLIYISQISLFGANFFYMYAFWKSISSEYQEAGLIDGGTHLGIFFKIMFPMVLPSAISLFIMLFITNWNNYEYTALYMREYADLAYGIYAFRNKALTGIHWPVYYAGVMMSFLPILALFVCFQNTIMEKVYIGGLKG